MTGEELKSALVSGAPVIHEVPGETPIEYARVRAIVYRRQIDMRTGWRCSLEAAPGIVVIVELLDRSGHSLMHADPAHVRFAEPEIPQGQGGYTK